MIIMKIGTRLTGKFTNLYQLMRTVFRIGEQHKKAPLKRSF